MTHLASSAWAWASACELGFAVWMRMTDLPGVHMVRDREVYQQLRRGAGWIER